MSGNSYKHLGLDIQQIALVAFDRTEDSLIDIKSMCFEIGIIEDILSKAIHIQVGVEDALGLIERMPLVGDEKIVISYRTPSFDDYVEAEFDVHKHSVINKSKERVRQYVIHGISPEAKTNIVSSVDASYKLSGSETVKAIHSTYFKSNKKLEVSDSFGTQYFIGNGRLPFHFIDQIIEDSQSEKYPASNYMFYETLERKYYFKTLDELMQGDVVQDFYFADAGKKIGSGRSASDTIFPYQVITDIEVKDGINGLNKILGGGYRNSVKVVDPVTKTFSERTFDYLTDDKLTQIAKHKTIPQETSFLKDNTENIHSRLIRSTVLPPPSPASIVRQGIADGVGDYIAEGAPSTLDFFTNEEIVPEGSLTSIFDQPEEDNTSSLQGTTIGGFTVGGGADSFGTGSTSTDSPQGTTIGGFTVGGGADSFGTLLGPGSDITFFEERVTADTDPQYFYPKRRHNFAHLDVASRVLLDNTITINCTVSGISDLHVGQVVNIFVPQESNDEEFMSEYNLFYGGEDNAKFLITKVSHAFSFSKAVYVTSFSCVKNSFASGVKTESQRLTGSGSVGDVLTAPLKDVVRSIF